MVKCICGGERGTCHGVVPDLKPSAGTVEVNKQCFSTHITGYFFIEKITGYLEYWSRNINKTDIFVALAFFEK